MEAVDSLIKALSNHIKENIKKAMPNEIAEMTKALAELVSARAAQN